MKEKLGFSPFGITFLYVDHGPENSRDVVAKTKDFDVILEEGTGSSPAYRADREAAIAQTTYETNVFNKFRGVLPYIMNSNSKFNNPIILKAIYSKKEFHFIDVDASTPEYGFRRLICSETDDSIYKFLNGSPSDALAIFTNATNLVALSNQQREEYVVKQIEEMGRLYEDAWAGKRILAIQGYMHSGTFRMFKDRNPGVKTSISFLYPLHYFNPTNSIVRQQLYKPDSEVPEQEYKRALIYGILIYPRFSGNPVKANLLSVAVARKLTEKNIQYYWGKIEDAEQEFRRSENLRNYKKQLDKVAAAICKS